MNTTEQKIFPLNGQDRFNYLASFKSFNAQLIRSVDEDVLGVKMNHASADGGGVKEYLILLAGIYTQLCQDPLYQPQINYDARRDQKNYFDTLGIPEPITLFNPDQSPDLPTWTFPYQNLEIGSMFVSKRRINGENYRRLLEYSKEQSVQ